MQILLLVSIVCLARPAPISAFTLEVQMDRIEQIGGERLLDLSGIRIRKYNRTLAVINGTYSIVRDLDDSLEFTVTVARSTLGNNQFNEYPMKIPRKDGCRIFLEDYAEYQHVWANTTNLPQLDKAAPPALCALPKGNYWVKDFAPDASWVLPVVPEGLWRMTWHMYSAATDDLEGQRSRYLIARPVKSTNFDCTKKVLDDIFEREGFPKTIRSDNGPPFNGDEYKSYCANRGIETVFSTPLFPQQNGLVENAMKIINKATSTAISEKTNFMEELQSAINAHNAAAHSVTGVPPEEVMMGRKIKRRLPLLSHAEARHTGSDINIRDKKAKLSSKAREDARRGARPSRVGDTRFDPTRFTVVEEDDGNLTLSSDSGQILKRHVSQTKKVFGWRTPSEAEDQPELGPEHESGSSRQEHITVDEEQRGPTTEPVRRSAREKRRPGYLDQFVRRLNHV